MKFLFKILFIISSIALILSNISYACFPSSTDPNFPSSNPVATYSNLSDLLSALPTDPYSSTIISMGFFDDADSASSARTSFIEANDLEWDGDLDLSNLFGDTYNISVVQARFLAEFGIDTTVLGGVVGYKRVGWYNSGDGIKYFHWWYNVSITGYEVCSSDSDGDGINDEYDLYPDDNSTYKAAISSVLYNSSTGEVVAGIISVDNGDQFSFGTVPSNLDGYTSETLDNLDFDSMINSHEALQTQLENVTGDLNFTQVGVDGIQIDSDGFYNENSTNTGQIIINNIDSPDAVVGSSTGTTSGTASTGSETDNEALRMIVDNTKTSTDNEKRIADYLKTNNDLLSQISTKVGQSSGGDVTLNVETPTAVEIGQAVGDNLIDSNQTHDDSQTTGIAGYDFGSKFTDEKIKYSDRFTSFTDTFKNSTLFSLPSTLIGDIPAGGVSTFDVSIGKWGGATDENLSFDLQNYNIVWDSLKYILPILTAFAVLNILVLKIN